MDPIRKRIVVLMKLNGTHDEAEKHFQAARESFKKMGVSRKGLNQLRDLASQEHLIDLLAPIWEEHYSVEELDALIAFYSSPIGKKYSRTQREALPKIMAVMQKWLKGIFQSVFEEVE